MTPAQKKLKELRERQSRERQRMAELGLLDSLDTETRAEFDSLEQGVPDLERSLRGAQIAVDLEEGAQRTETREDEPDAEMRERIELRGKARLTNYLLAAAQGRMPSGPESELARQPVCRKSPSNCSECPAIGPSGAASSTGWMHRRRRLARPESISTRSTR